MSYDLVLFIPGKLFYDNKVGDKELVVSCYDDYAKISLTSIDEKNSLDELIVKLVDKVENVMNDLCDCNTTLMIGFFSEESDMITSTVSLKAVTLESLCKNKISLELTIYPVDEHPKI